MDEDSEIIFREEQRFELKIVLPLIFLTLLMVVGSVKAVVGLNQSSHGNPLVILLLIIVGIILPILVSVLFALLTLETEVRSDGLYVRFFPLHINYKRFGPENLERYHARVYKPIGEYGGWGIRWGKKGKAYNVKGNKSVQLILKNGEKLLIGSQKPYDLIEAMDSVMKNSQLDSDGKIQV
jgi:hypothetical protein